MARKMLVHDETNQVVVGDVVEICYAGKISENKAFKINQILKEARKFIHPVTGKLYSV